MNFSLVPIILAADKGTAAWEAKDCAKDGAATITGIQCIIGNILEPLPGLIALAAVGMIIWAGARMIGAGADQKAYAAAWSTFTYAIVGLILLSVVWLALILIERFTGAPVTQFGI